MTDQQSPVPATPYMADQQSPILACVVITLAVRYERRWGSLQSRSVAAAATLSVLWTGDTKGGFRPICHAIIRNVNE